MNLRSIVTAAAVSLCLLCVAAADQRRDENGGESANPPRQEKILEGGAFVDRPASPGQPEYGKVDRDAGRSGLKPDLSRIAAAAFSAVIFTLVLLVPVAGVMVLLALAVILIGRFTASRPEKDNKKL